MKIGKRWLAVLLFILVVPTTVGAASNITDQRAVLLQLIELLQQQILLLQAELEARQTAVAVVEPSVTEIEIRLSDAVEVSRVYPLATAEMVEQIADAADRQYFIRVFELFPAKYDAVIQELVVFTGDVGFDAFVETLPPSHETWRYAVHEQVVAEGVSGLADELIVHELAHLISYESITSQSVTGSECHRYFRDQGCPPDNSYLIAFVDEFWSDADLRTAIEIRESRDRYDETTELYEDDPDHFVTEYASQNPEEDFAESFMFFVLDEESSGREATEKIEFFAAYDELRRVKELVGQEL